MAEVSPRSGARRQAPAQGREALGTAARMYFRIPDGDRRVHESNMGARTAKSMNGAFSPVLRDVDNAWPNICRAPAMIFKSELSLCVNDEI